MRRPPTVAMIFALSALLLWYWITRTHALLTLPLFLDEGSHLYRAQLVWEGSPLYLLETGKALAPYLAAFFDPYHGTMFIGRYVVILLGVIGLASAYGVGHVLHSRAAGMVVMVLWISAPQLFFFERMALVDTTISAMALFSLWLAVRAIKSGRAVWAVGCGMALALTVIAKLTGIVFIAIPVWVALLLPGRWKWSRLRQVILAGATAGLILAPIALYILSRGADPTGQSTALTSMDTATMPERLRENLSAIFDAFQVFYHPVGLLTVLSLGLYFVLRYPRRGLILLFPMVSLLLAIGAFANELWLRYAAPLAPFLLLLGAMGWAQFSHRLMRLRLLRTSPRLAPVILCLWAMPLIGMIRWGTSFQAVAYTDPTQLSLPRMDRVEYITWIPSGYGIREASQYLADLNQPLTAIGVAVNCQGARLMAPPDSQVRYVCPPLDWGGRKIQPALDAISAALQEDLPVYVITEDRRPETVPKDKFPGRREEVAVFKRPSPYYIVRVYRLYPPGE